MTPKAVIIFGMQKLSDARVTEKFTLYGDVDATKAEHQEYTRARDY